MGGPMISILLLFVLILGIGSLILGLWLLLRWRRGRRSGTHPTCRACGFDLRGLTPTNSDSTPSAPCPECGTALTPDNIAKGDPRRSPFTLVVALLCILLALGIFGLALRRIWPTLTSRLPTPILVVQSALDRTDSLGTVTELASRVGTTRMSADHAATLIDRALDQQKNALVWIPAWGLIVETAYGANLTTHEQWQQYLHVAATPMVEVSSKVAAGDPLSIDLGVKNSRVSQRSQSLPMISMQPTIDVDGVRITDSRLRGGTFGLAPGGATWSTYSCDTSALQPGQRTLTLRIQTPIRQRTGDGSYDDSKPPTITLDYTITRPLTVETKGTATHAMKTDAALAEAVRKAIDVRDFTLEDGYPEGTIRASHFVYFEALPHGVAMQMILQVRNPDGTFIERIVGKVAREAQPKTGSHGVGGGMDIKDPAPFVEALRIAGEGTLVLRPDLDVAKTRPNLYEIWGEEIVVPSVKVKLKLKAIRSEQEHPKERTPAK